MIIEEMKYKVRDIDFGSGDFRSEYCTRLLNESDIVVTNPPFSLFREFFAWLMKADKKFIIIGNMNAITYKEVFPYIRRGELKFGYKSFGGGMNFVQPPETFDASLTKSYKIVDNKIIKNIMGCIWFTNVDLQKHHEPLILVEKYTPEKYPKYDNYDAIEVSKVKEIPCDYDGVMGVPITYMYCHNPDQFDIIGLSSKNECGDVTVIHDRDYYRGFIRGKVAVNVDSTMPLLTTSDFGGTKCVHEDGRVVYQLYHRLFIRRKVVN